MDNVDRQVMTEAERQVIGGLFIDSSCISKIANDLTPEMFASKLLGEVYRSLLIAYNNSEEVTILSVSQYLELKGISRESVGVAIKSCVSSTDTSLGVVSNAKVIIYDFKANNLKTICSSIKITPVAIDEQIGELIVKLETLKSGKRSCAKHLGDIVKEYSGMYFKDLEERKLYIGFDRVDEILGGLEGGDVIVIGARPAVGKSAFTSQIAFNLAAAGKRVGFYNLEMSDKQIYERLLSSKSSIGLTRIRRAKRFLNDEAEKFESANAELEKLPLIISSGTKSISEIRAECRHLELDCIIIDYLQLVRADVRYQSRASEVGAISKAVKSLAMELNIPIIALSQLNRVSEGREDREPTMSELREAGDIEQDASVVMLMWNLKNEEPNKKVIKVEKNRQGETGTVMLRFNGNKMQFVESDEMYQRGSRRNNDKGFIRYDGSLPFDT